MPLPNMSTANLGITSISKRILVTGDSGCGKSTLIRSLVGDTKSIYEDGLFDETKRTIAFQGKQVKLVFCDTNDNDEYGAYRRLLYGDVDIVLVCFSLVCCSSFAQAKNKWINEARELAPPHSAIILVGCKNDLVPRHNLKSSYFASKRVAFENQEVYSSVKLDSLPYSILYFTNKEPTLAIQLLCNITSISLGCQGHTKFNNPTHKDASENGTKSFNYFNQINGEKTLLHIKSGPSKVFFQRWFRKKGK